MSSCPLDVQDYFKTDEPLADEIVVSRITNHELETRLRDLSHMQGSLYMVPSLRRNNMQRRDPDWAYFRSLRKIDMRTASPGMVSTPLLTPQLTQLTLIMNYNICILDCAFCQKTWLIRAVPLTAIKLMYLRTPYIQCCGRRPPEISLSGSYRLLMWAQTLHLLDHG